VDVHAAAGRAGTGEVTPAPGSDAADASHAAWWRIALGGGGGMFVGMGLGRFSYTAMVPALVDAGGMTAVEAGRIGMVNLIGFMLGAAVSAMVLSLALIAATAPERKRPVAASFMFAGVGIGVFMSGTLVPLLLSHGLVVTWGGLALAGFAGVVLAIWGWSAAPDLRPPAASLHKAAVAWRPLAGLLVAHALFSLGIVPHTLYWVDYIARGLGQGIAIGGLYWSLVGVFSVLGPWMAARLALRMGAAWGLVAGFVALSLGIGGPALWPVVAMLVLSSALFGAQPGMSVLMAVRVRELGSPEAMPRVMRAMILANSCGAVIGGLTVPALYGLTGSHGAVFLLGGAAMLTGAMAAWPSQQRGWK
jgi:hypothetical protein